MPIFGHHRLGRTFPASLALLCLAGTGAFGQTDPALENAQRLVHRAFLATRDAPLSNNPETGQIVAALRSSGDKDLLPFFLKLQQSSTQDNKIFGMVAATILAKQSGQDPESKDFKYLDLKVLFSSQDPGLIGAALASLIDAGAISAAQLRQIIDTAPDASHRAMAAGELNRLKKLDDRKCLQDLIKNDKDIVKYYAALTMLSGPDDEQTTALAVLKTMTEAHQLRQAPIQALMLVRMQKENITGALPWAAQIAADEQSDEGLRYTAVATLLSFKAPEGATILADMIQKQKDAMQQVKLGLIALEYGNQLQPAILAPLLNSKSALAKSIAQIAQKNMAGADILPGMLALLKEGHPIVLDWALAYADRAPAERQLALRAALINQATIVDGLRDRDYERAAVAAQKILTDNGDAGRQLIAGLLKSENRAVAEATLAGIFRSDAKNQAQLITPAIWDDLNNATSADASTNFAALILAREGHTEVLSWLDHMVMTAQSSGFRALAGWYYAKLKGQDKAFLAAVLAE